MLYGEVKTIDEKGMVLISKKIMDSAGIKRGSLVFPVVLEQGIIALVAIDQENEAVKKFLEYLKQLEEKAKKIFEKK